MSSAVPFGYRHDAPEERSGARDRLRLLMQECLEDAAAIGMPSPGAHAPPSSGGRIPPLFIGGAAARAAPSAGAAQRYPADVVAIARDLFQARLRAEGWS